MLLTEKRETIPGFIATLIVVIVGLWLLSDKPPSKKVMVTQNHDNVVEHASSGDYEQAVNDDNIAYTTDSETVTDISGINTQSLQKPVVQDAELFAADGESISDNEWFSALMQKAKNNKDRVININISGSRVTEQTYIPGDNINIDINDENSLLPQPTQADTLVENTVDCASVMYMGGNEYGRNMLIKMGCLVP
jgi:hypothetical protein